MDEIKLTGESKDIVSENISKLRGIFQIYLLKIKLILIN